MNRKLEIKWKFVCFINVNKIHVMSCIITIGPSGVRALPLAAGINVGGQFNWHFSLLLSFFLPAHC